MSDDPGATLRGHVEGDDVTVLPGAYDALSARIAAERFAAVFTSGFGLSATTLGLPDMGFLGMRENLDRVRHVARTIDVPLVADLDTGYGNALNVRRTVGEAMGAGVAGGILEDQAWPKRCGHMDEKRVVPAEEHAAKIRAAADERDDRDRDFVIVGRTDAREPHGLDEAIDRGRRYAEAGADVVFVEAPESREELERVATAFEKPSFANMIEGGKTPYLPGDELEEMGFGVVVYPLSGLFAATRALQDVYVALDRDGETSAVEGMGFDDFDDVIDADRYRDMAGRYG